MQVAVNPTATHAGVAPIVANVMRQADRRAALAELPKSAAGVYVPTPNPLVSRRYKRGAKLPHAPLVWAMHWSPDEFKNLHRYTVVRGVLMYSKGENHARATERLAALALKLKAKPSENALRELKRAARLSAKSPATSIQCVRYERMCKRYMERLTEEALAFSKRLDAKLNREDRAHKRQQSGGRNRVAVVNTTLDRLNAIKARKGLH